MNIRKILIKNFRSIKELEFEPTSLCALIGENNSGKSNILKAINLVLGDTWPSVRNISDDDIYNKDPQSEIEISLLFDQALITNKDSAGHDYEVHGFCLRYRHYKRKTGMKKKGDPKVEFVTLDKNGAEIKIIKKLQKGQASFPETLNVNTELKELVPAVYIGVDRDLEKELSGSRWTLLGKLFIELAKEFAEDAYRISRYESISDEINKLLRIDSFNALEKIIKSNVQRQTGMKDVELKFSPVGILDYYKSLGINVKENSKSQESDSLEMGSGIQSAITIAIINAYREIKKTGAILLIEEPEVYLHPHIRRFFYQLLEELSKSGNQIFYATHSTEFVHLENYENICVVRKTPDAGTQIVQGKNLTLASSDKSALKLETEFDSQKSEIFFARKVLLVEGKTERYSLPYAFRLHSINIDEAGISILDSGSKSNLKFFIKILKSFNIPFIVLHDEDSNNKDYELLHKKLNQEIETESVDKDLVFRMDPDFEGLFGLDGKEKVLKARLTLSSLTKKEELPAIINDAINKLINI